MGCYYVTASLRPHARGGSLTFLRRMKPTWITEDDCWCTTRVASGQRQYAKDWSRSLYFCSAVVTAVLPRRRRNWNATDFFFLQHFLKAEQYFAADLHKIPSFLSPRLCLTQVDVGGPDWLSSFLHFSFCKSTMQCQCTKGRKSKPLRAWLDTWSWHPDTLLEEIWSSRSGQAVHAAGPLTDRPGERCWIDILSL